MRSRLFAEAVGALAKTDRIDAKVLAMMAESLQPKAVAPLPAELENLQELRRARQAAVDDRTALSNQLGETKGAFLQRGLKRRLEQVSEFIARLEAEIQRLIDSDPELARRYAIVKSIRGIGPVAAVALIVGLAELGTCSAKQAAMLAGLARELKRLFGHRRQFDFGEVETPDGEEQDLKSVPGWCVLDGEGPVDPVVNFRDDAG